jgi:hypothetical protein
VRVRCVLLADVSEGGPGGAGGGGRLGGVKAWHAAIAAMSVAIEALIRKLPL